MTISSGDTLSGLRNGESPIEVRMDAELVDGDAEERKVQELMCPLDVTESALRLHHTIGFYD